MSKYYSSSIAFGANQTKTEKVVVSPTKIGDVTTDAVSGALTVDEVPTLDSLNPVSSDGVARSVSEAVGSSVNLVQGEGIVLTESSGNVTISAATSGGVPVLHSLDCYETENGRIRGELPEGEYLAKGLYQVFLKFSMRELNDTYRYITYGFQVDHSDWFEGGLYYPVDIDSNGPFGDTRAFFIRNGYVKVESQNEVSGLYIVFRPGPSGQVTGGSNLNNISVQYMKVADLS